VSYNTAAIETLLVDVFLEAHRRAPAGHLANNAGATSCRRGGAARCPQVQVTQGQGLNLGGGYVCIQEGAVVAKLCLQVFSAVGRSGQ
jgi:hypothetical protein